MTEALRVKLRLLTPLWTGGVETGRMERIHETGVIGSLRWWYEVVVRGLGADACDPTDHQCTFKEEAFQRPDSEDSEAWRQALLQAGVCDACQSYGATGWARRFRLRLSGGQHLDFTGPLKVKPIDRTRGWYLPAGMSGAVNGSVTARPLFSTASLAVSLAMARRWGGLGARTQHGYGVAGVGMWQGEKRLAMDQAILRTLPTGSHTDDLGRPSLRNMFFARATLEMRSADWWTQVDGLQRLDSSDRKKLTAWRRTGSVPVSPSIRNQIRFLRTLGLADGGPENFVFGSANPVCKQCYGSVSGRGEAHRCHTCGPVRDSQILERSKTKIHISSAYAPYEDERLWRVRVWGWIPRSPPAGVGLDREVPLSALHHLLQDTAMWGAALGSDIEWKRTEWREYASPRDQKTGEATDAYAFLTSLVGEETGR